jgi:transcription antitermination factor NusG
VFDGICGMTRNPTPPTWPTTASAPPDHRWWVLHTLNRHEAALASLLTARSIGCYLPRVPREKIVRGRKVRDESALFPNYLFVFGSAEQVYVADRTKKVANILEVQDQARFQHELESIRLALAAGPTPEPARFLQRGDRVRVVRGPMAGAVGYIEVLADRHQLILQIETLGQAVSVQVRSEDVEPVD